MQGNNKYVQFTVDTSELDKQKQKNHEIHVVSVFLTEFLTIVDDQGWGGALGNFSEDKNGFGAPSSC